MFVGSYGLDLSSCIQRRFFPVMEKTPNQADAHNFDPSQ